MSAEAAAVLCPVVPQLTADDSACRILSSRQNAMRRYAILVVGFGVALATSCGKRVPGPPNLAPGTPHVSWVIMSGDRDNPDREFVCQSDPHSDCVVPASRPNEQTFSDVHVYYHGAGPETRYEGTIEVGFFQGAQNVRTMQTNIVVKKGESITNQSMTSIVTATPGTYAMRFAITATVTDSGTRQPIAETIHVTVR